MTDRELGKLAYELRQDAVDIIMEGGGGHIGGDMSLMEILVTLYFSEMNVSPETMENPDRDRFVLSKGHSVEALYSVLAKKGYFSLEEVKKGFNQFGSSFIGHPNNKLPGIEMNSGSLGHGLPVCFGMALAGKRDKKKYRVYTVMGDGELAEGSVWEAAMAASAYDLDNLCAVIDRNGLQISGSTEEVMAQEDLRERWSSFGWNVIEVEDGNDIGQLRKAFAAAEACKGKPSLILAHTIKGKGSEVMEGKASWHHHVPSMEEYRKIQKDLEQRKEAL